MEPKSFVLGAHVLQPHVFWRQSSIIYANEAGGTEAGRAGRDVLFSSHTVREAAAFVSAVTQLFTANAAITRLLIKRSQSDPITAIRQPCIQLPIAHFSNAFFFLLLLL